MEASGYTCCYKTPFKGSKKIILFIKIQSMPVFLDTTKVADFQWKNIDVSRSQGVCHVVYMVFGSSFGKI